MITIEDVFAHIAEGMPEGKRLKFPATSEEIVTGAILDFKLAITTDVEETESDFMNRYGNGVSSFFRLADYGHGKLLAGQMFWILKGYRPDMGQYTGEMFKPEDKLYLYVHLIDEEQVLINQRPE